MESKEKLESCMYHLIESLRKIAVLIKPFMNDTAENIFKQIGTKDEDLKKWKTLKQYDKIENTKVIEKGEPIFMRGVSSLSTAMSSSPRARFMSVAITPGAIAFTRIPEGPSSLASAFVIPIRAALVVE